MKVGDIVKVCESRPSAGNTGVILKMTSATAYVYWDESDVCYWIEKKYLVMLHKAV